jgi:cytochrome d ubiquinol oxidase subunit II
MNMVYLLNHAIFAAFLSLIVVEVGISVLGLAGYKEYWRRMKPYLMPMWEINGTFAVFYIVAFEAMYPQLLTLVGTAYIAPALIAGLFFILRNAFLSYSEYIGSEQHERRLVKVYSISTVIVAVLAVSIFTSAVSGSGVSVPLQSISVAAFLNAFNILAILSIVLIAIFCTKVLFGFGGNAVLDIGIAALGIVAMIIGAYAGPSYLLFSLRSNFDLALFVFELLFLFVVAVLHVSGKKLARFLVIPWLFSAIFAFTVFQYPYLFGMEVNMLSYTTSGAVSGYVVFITVAGGLMLAVSLLFLLYMTMRKPALIPSASRRSRKKA